MQKFSKFILVWAVVLVGVFGIQIKSALAADTYAYCWRSDHTYCQQLKLKQPGATICTDDTVGHVESFSSFEDNSKLFLDKKECESALEKSGTKKYHSFWCRETSGKSCVRVSFPNVMQTALISGLICNEETLKQFGYSDYLPPIQAGVPQYDSGSQGFGGVASCLKPFFVENSTIQCDDESNLHQRCQYNYPTSTPQKPLDCTTKFNKYLQTQNNPDFCTKDKASGDACRTECTKTPGCVLNGASKCVPIASISPSEATLEFYKTKVDPNYNGPIPKCALEGDCRDVNDLLLLLVNYGNMSFALAGSLALLVFVIGGITMILSFGNADKTKKGMEMIVTAVIGLVILFAAYLIVNFVLDALGVKSTFKGI